MSLKVSDVKVKEMSAITRRVEANPKGIDLIMQDLVSKVILTFRIRLKCVHDSYVLFCFQLQVSESLQPKAEKSVVDAAVGALNELAQLANECILLSEAHLCSNVTVILNAASHKQAPIRTAAETVLFALAENMNPNCIRELLPPLFEAAKTGVAWQTRVVSLKMIASFADHGPEQLGNLLPLVVPELTVSMNEPKKEVNQAAFQAMTNACNVIGNRDIEHMTSNIIRSISHPDEVPEIMHSLAGVTFVQSVQSPALAMVVPLLIRGLRSKVTATRRQSAVIIDNMSKLVDDPLDAEPFLPTLMPALEFSADSMSDPEARGVAERAVKQLNKLHEQTKHIKSGAVSVDKNAVLALLQSKIKKSGYDVEMNHIAALCTSLMSLRKFNEEEWKTVEKHIAIVTGSDTAKSILPRLRAECMEMSKTVIEADEDDDDAEELCNCQFTLAYGTKILLHNTMMKLKRGHKYGLLGGNESGKTTLMRSIANGSVEGFPDPSQVRTVFVEADIMGELSHLSCIDYILSDPQLASCDRNKALEVMASVGFKMDGKAKPTFPVSTLSGGWRMKLALARAMLQRADILLLDEPT